jgi:hypothetical protein
LHVGDWSLDQAAEVAYQLEIELGGLSENPAPLTSTAAPAVGIQLHGAGGADRDAYATPVVFVRPPAGLSAERVSSLSTPAAEPRQGSDFSWRLGSDSSPRGVGFSTFFASYRTVDPVLTASDTSRQTAPVVGHSLLTPPVDDSKQPADEWPFLAGSPAGLFRSFGAAPLGSEAGTRTVSADEWNDEPLVRLRDFDESDSLVVRLDSLRTRQESSSRRQDGDWMARWAARDRDRRRTRADDSAAEPTPGNESAEDLRSDKHPRREAPAAATESADSSAHADGAAEPPRPAEHQGGSGAPTERVRTPTPARPTLR